MDEDPELARLIRVHGVEVVGACNELARVSASLRPHDAEALDSAFNTLATLIERSPDPAEGFRALWMLLAMPHSIGKAEGESAATWKHTKGHGRTGAKISAAVRRKKQAEKWADQGLIIARNYISRRPAYKNSEIARHIKGKPGAPGKRQIEAVIAKWQLSRLIPLPQKL